MFFTFSRFMFCVHRGIDSSSMLSSVDVLRSATNIHILFNALSLLNLLKTTK